MAIPLDLEVLGLVLAITAVWAFALWFVWRQRWFERMILGRNVVAPRETPAQPQQPDALRDSATARQHDMT